MRRTPAPIDEAELKRRLAALPAKAAAPQRGYASLYGRDITSADRGYDFAFLTPDGR